MDSVLRDALTRASVPAEVGPDERHRIRDAVDADRRRRRALLVVAGSVAAVVATAVGVGLLASRTDDRAGVTDQVDGPPAGAWDKVARGPLSPRDNPVAAWTGSEVIVVGGISGRPCPPDAAYECGGPSNYRTEAAAYNPETDTWRELAPAPEAVPGGDALWWEDRLLVVNGRLTLTYDPATDRWERLPDLDDAEAWSGLIATDDGPVRFAYQQTPGSGMKVDWRLDPATGTWSPLPRDPFAGESYDRTMAWYDGRLWLLSMPFESHMEGYASSRIAVLDGDTWTVIDEETPDVAYEQRLVRQGDLLVVPASAYGLGGVGRAFDPSSGEWSTLPDPGASESSCPLGDATVGPAWVASDTGLFSASRTDSLAVPPCPGVARPAVTVWAGDGLFIWGGPNADYDRNVADGWVWTPRPPE